MHSMRRFINILRETELLEGRDAPLYHFTSLSSASRIVRDGAISAGSAMVDRRGWHGISTTRDSRLWYGDQPGNAEIGFQLDQARIARRFKIIPIDDTLDDSSVQRRSESEEFVVASRLPLVFVKAVIVPTTLGPMKNTFDRFAETVKAAGLTVVRTTHPWGDPWDDNVSPSWASTYWRPDSSR